MKFHNMNAMFYFYDPTLDVGLTYSSSHTALHRVAASHTGHLQQILINFDEILLCEHKVYNLGSDS